MDKEFKNVYIKNGKLNAPFLLAASFRGLIIPPFGWTSLVPLF